jgi:hypothetical protein
LEVPGLALPGKWCSFCRPGTSDGCCTIHDKRPDVCLGFNCFWRAEEWPDWLRPDKCKIIFEALPGVSTILLSVDPGTPDAWKKKEILEVIEKLRRKGRPLVLKTEKNTVFFITEKADKGTILKEIKQVIDWKEKSNDRAFIHDRFINV